MPTPEFLALIPPGSCAALERIGADRRRARERRIAERIAASPFKPYGDSIERALATVDAAARRSAINLKKGRARDFLAMPWQLDVLREGLSEVEPADGLRIVADLRAAYLRAPWRCFGSFTVTSGIGGARLFFRYLRRFPEVCEGSAPAPAARHRRVEVIRDALRRAQVEGRP